MTQMLSDKLRTAQRRMLRMMLSSRRRHDEQTWVEWIQTETIKVEATFQAHGGKCWHQVAEESKKVFVTKTILQEDGRWNNRLLHWQPRGRRNPGRPWRRWEDVYFQSPYFNVKS